MWVVKRKSGYYAKVVLKLTDTFLSEKNREDVRFIPAQKSTACNSVEYAPNFRVTK